MRILCLILVLSWVVADEAHADSAFDGERAALAKEIGKRSLNRGRRSLSLGPTIGLAPGVGLDSGDVAGQISVGLALLRYDISILPSPKRVQAILESRFKAALAEKLKAAVVGSPEPTPADHARIARETWDEIKAEFLLENRPKRWEKPSFGIRLEVTHLIDPGAWHLRGMASLGLGPVFLSAGPSLRLNEGVGLVVPVELSKPMMLSKGLRSPVVEFFLRAELAATGRNDHEDSVLLGARFMLDVI